MFFPDNMNFQYLFFSTYIGYFLQMLPIALVAFVLSFIRRTRKEPERSPVSRALAALFPAYLAALLGLTLFSDLIGDAYYILFYHQRPWPAGEGGYRWFTFVYDFRITLFQHFDAENMGNILLFFPFGILHPWFNRKSTWCRTVLLGVGTCLAIELIQPLMDRSFDLNDIILNCLAVLVSASLFFGARKFFARLKGTGANP